LYCHILLVRAIPTLESTESLILTCYDTCAFPHEHDCTGTPDSSSWRTIQHYSVCRIKKTPCTGVLYRYVSLLQSLHNLLSDATVIDQIEQSSNRLHSDGTLHDICDGELFRLYSFSQDQLALQITAFYDEVELCTLLGLT